MPDKIFYGVLNLLCTMINPEYLRMDFDFWEAKLKKYVILQYRDGKNKAVDITDCAGLREVAIEILKYLNGAR